MAFTFPFTARPTIKGRKRQKDIGEQMMGSDPEMIAEFDRVTNIRNLTSPDTTAAKPIRGGWRLPTWLGGDPDFTEIKGKIAEKRKQVVGLRAMKKWRGGA